MSTSRKGQSRPSGVWLVGEDPLAVRYMQDTLVSSRISWIGSCEDTLRRRAATKGPPTVIVVDSIATPNPAEGLLQPLRSLFPKARILVVGRAAADEDLYRLLLLGVWGFVSYDEVRKHLNRAVCAVWGGHLWVKREVLEKFPDYAGRVRKAEGSGISALTPREKTVLSLLGRRLSNKEIASMLKISERTVKFHLQSIYTKLGVHDRHSAADFGKTIHYSEIGLAQPAKGLMVLGA